MKKNIIAVAAAITVLAISAASFAATQSTTQSGTRTQIKSGTCVK